MSGTCSGPQVRCPGCALTWPWPLPMPNIPLPDVLPCPACGAATPQPPSIDESRS